MDKFQLRNYDFDICPKTDNPVIRGDCDNCKYYAGFQMANGFPCVECTYNYLEEE